MNIRSALKRAIRILDFHGSATPELDAEILLAHCLRMDRSSLYTHPERWLTEFEYGEFESFLMRRQRGEPVAYIVKKKEFWSLLFDINEHVLVPRPETEVLVEEALKVCSEAGYPNPEILEIGTGCGAISISLASELKGARIVATDISREALLIAKTNALKHGVEELISFLNGSLFDPVSGTFDIVISNPPYISEEEYEQLPADVRLFEPKSALIAENGGTSFHREIIRQGVFYIKRGGWLLMEIGSGQRCRVESVLRESKFYDTISFRADYTGIERVSKARRKTEGG